MAMVVSDGEKHVQTNELKDFVFNTWRDLNKINYQMRALSDSERLRNNYQLNYTD